MKRFLQRFLGRKSSPGQPPVRDERGLNADWKPGDLAECIEPGLEALLGPGPKAGTIYRVASVYDGASPDGSLQCTALGLEEFGGDGWWCRWFRKVEHRIEPAEAEWVAQLRSTIKRKVDV